MTLWIIIAAIIFILGALWLVLGLDAEEPDTPRDTRTDDEVQADADRAGIRYAGGLEREAKHLLRSWTRSR